MNQAKKLRVTAATKDFVSLSTESSYLPWIGSLLKLPLPIHNFSTFAIVTNIETPPSDVIANLTLTPPNIPPELVTAAAAAYQTNLSYRVSATILGYFTEDEHGANIYDVTYGAPPSIPLVFTEATPLSPKEIQIVLTTNPRLFFAHLITIQDWRKLLPAFFHYLHSKNLALDEEEKRNLYFCLLDAFFAHESDDERLKTLITMEAAQQPSPSSLSLPPAAPEHQKMNYLP